MELKRALEDSSTYIMNTYNRAPVVLVKGRGMKVWGSDGKEYLDFLAGVATDVLGHCHPKVVVAIQKQAQRLLHVSNLFHIEPQIKLAKLLVDNSFADRVFFCNSGAEANEAAIKLARKYSAENHGSERYEIITAINSFHGRTMGALSATGQEKFHKGFGPMLPGFKFVPYNDVSAIKKAVTASTCAIMLEPVQGESGVRVPSPQYLKDVRAICDEHGLLLILDEVQTGMGRTGKLFAYEHSAVSPDIMTLAKGLGGGVPIGAMLAVERVASTFKPGDHAATFGGNPLVCAAAIATLETVLEGGYLLDQCRRVGAYMTARLNHLKEKFPSIIVEVRGIGLIQGIEITRDCSPAVKACMERGLLVNCTAGSVIRFVPPLIAQEEHVDQMIDILHDVLERMS